MANKASISVELVGLKEALRGLDGFNKAIRYRVTRDAVNAGAGLLRDAARKNVPTQTRLLKNNLVVRTFVPKNDSGIYCKVGARRGVKKQVYTTARGKTSVLSGKKLAAANEAGAKKVYRSPSRYLHLLEHGTKPHLVQAKNATILSNGRATFGIRAMVGAKPRQPLTFTARSAGPRATARSISKLQKEIRIEAAKAARKSAARAVARSDK